MIADADQVAADVVLVTGAVQIAGEKGSTKTWAGAYRVESIEQHYTTSKYPVSRAESYFDAAFGEFAIKIGPKAGGQWLHGTKGFWPIDALAIKLNQTGSHGCVRFNNSDIADLATSVKKGTPVVKIYPFLVIRDGNVEVMDNPYGYADFQTPGRERIFLPDEAQLIGPKKGWIAPLDSKVSGEKNPIKVLRAAGMEVITTSDPVKAADQAVSTSEATPQE